MKIALKSAARALFHHAGGTWVTRFKSRNGARILMYHRFPPGSCLEAQCEHLKKYYRPISLTELGLSLQHKRKLPPLAVVFTVDDGYRDFFLEAFPILSAHSIPAIVFLATDMLDTGRCLWVDWVGVLFNACSLPKIELELPGRPPVEFRLSSPQDRKRAALETKAALKLTPNDQRLWFLAKLPGLLGLEAPPAIPPEHAPLSWDEVRLMANAGVEFGAHTRSHPILSQVNSVDEVRAELCGSKQRIEQETGQPVLHFCYPNGHLCDFTPETVSIVRECGFLTAVTGEKGINFTDADRYQLRRLHQEPSTPLAQYAHQVAGFSR